jgi:uncharacterized protein YuzE
MINDEDFMETTDIGIEYDQDGEIVGASKEVCELITNKQMDKAMEATRSF